LPSGFGHLESLGAGAAHALCYTIAVFGKNDTSREGGERLVEKGESERTLWKVKRSHTGLKKRGRPYR
jgi:hypothetical protein